MQDEQESSTAEELTSDQKRDNVIRLAFGGSKEKFDEFIRVVRARSPKEPESS